MRSVLKKKIVIGLLGKVGSGKSACAAVFKQSYGATVIDADEIAHELLGKKTMQARLKKGLGLVRATRIDISKAVFRDRKKLRFLESVLHPSIKVEMKRRLDAAKKGIVVIDAPLLLEKKLDLWCDYLLYIHCKDNYRFRRLSARDLVKKEVQRREKYQMSALLKRKEADYAINNNGKLSGLRAQARDFMDFLREVEK